MITSFITCQRPLQNSQLCHVSNGAWLEHYVSLLHEVLQRNTLDCESNNWRDESEWRSLVGSQLFSTVVLNLKLAVTFSTSDWLRGWWRLWKSGSGLRYPERKWRAARSTWRLSFLCLTNYDVSLTRPTKVESSKYTWNFSSEGADKLELEFSRSLLGHWLLL